MIYYNSPGSSTRGDQFLHPNKNNDNKQTKQRKNHTKSHIAIQRISLLNPPPRPQRIFSVGLNKRGIREGDKDDF